MFKVGDIVVVIDNTDLRGSLNVGDIYRVTRTYKDKFISIYENRYMLYDVCHFSLDIKYSRSCKLKKINKIS